MEEAKTFAEMVKNMPRLNPEDTEEYYSRKNEERRDAECEARIAALEKELA